MIPNQPRFLYIGMVCTQAYGKGIGQSTFIGAASGKMCSVVSALRLAGRRAVLVSLPFVKDEVIYQPGNVCRGDGFPALFLPTWRSAVIRKLLGAFLLAWFAIRRVRQQDIILFYNHATEYILALLVFKLRGIAVFQDIEDIPNSADRGLRGSLNRLGYLIMFKLASPRKVTVSNQIGNSLDLREFLAIQGIATETVSSCDTEKWMQLMAGAPLRVHFGGTLMPTTGLDLFCAALLHLDAIAGSIGRKIEFIVTGVGDLRPVHNFNENTMLQSGWLSVEVHEGITRDVYFGLFGSCHASLSLRSPEAEISSTTFPSKVIEITSGGLALVSTQVSDIDHIFSDDSAWLLPEFSAPCLSSALLEMAQNPVEVRRRAEAGKVLVRTRFAPLAVGRRLAEFLDAGPILR